MTKQLELARDASKDELDPETYKIKAFIAGPSGSGKTQSSTTLPGKRLHLDFDGRSATLAGIANTHIIEIIEKDPRSPRAWQKAEAILAELTTAVGQKKLSYDSIIADGLTSMGRQSMNWALLLDPGRGLGGAPARQHYLPQMDTLSKYVLRLLALPLHVCVTGHLELFEDEEMGGHKLYPKITGKLRSEVANWFNECYYSYRSYDSEKKKTRYYWMTAGSGRQEFFKSSLNQLGRFWNDPISLDFSSGKPVGFMDLLERRFSGSSSKAASQKTSGTKEPSGKRTGQGDKMATALEEGGDKEVRSD